MSCPPLVSSEQEQGQPLIDAAKALPRKHPIGDTDPSPGERILLFQKREILQQVLRKEKTMEVRHLACTPGGAWLGVDGWVHAWGRFGQSFVAGSLEEFRDYQGEHGVAVDALPYRQTHLWPLIELRRLPEPVQFKRIPGPTTWVGFCPPDDAVECGAQRGGLVNAGNSCFINAALQALYTVTPWRRMLRRLDGEVAVDLLALLHRLQCSSIVNPETILQKWYHGEQEDSLEFLHAVSEQAGLTAQTAGVEQFQLRCQDCGGTFAQGSATAMSEMQMELPGGVSDMQGVVDNYFRSTLAPEDVKYCDRAWQCPSCESCRLPLRQLKIRQPPTVLVAAVKRWRTAVSDGRFIQHKDKTQVNFAEIVQVQGHVYHVVATVHHIGATPNGGHYYAVAYDPEGHRRVFNDTTVADVVADSVADLAAGAASGELYYMLLQKVTTDLPEQSVATRLDASTAADTSPEHLGGTIDKEAAATPTYLSCEKVQSQSPSSTGQAQGVDEAAGLGRPRGAASVDGLVPQAVSPMECLRSVPDAGFEDAERAFEQDVVAFMNSVCEQSVAEALRDTPACSTYVAKLTFEQCLTRLQAGLKAVRAEHLTAAEEVDVFTPLWWLTDYRLAVYMEAFARVVALSSTMLLETFKAFASSLLHRQLCVEWSDYTLAHRYWAQVVTDIGTGKSPVMKTVREAFKRAVAGGLHIT